MEQNNENRPAAVGPETEPKQAGEAARWGWVERCVWTDRMLSRLESNEEEARVWFSLMDKVYAPQNLEQAMKSVCDKKGSGGVDGQSVEQFKAGAVEGLRGLGQELRDGTYRPRPVKRVWIPKPGSSEERPLGIPAVRDRVVQAALRQVMEPIFEKGFSEQSYGFRPGRGAKDALRVVQASLEAGSVWVVDADLKSYFDTIPQDRLMALVRERVADGRVLELIEKFLRAGVMEQAKGWQPTERGTPQGGVISPLLANLYLDPLDHEMARRGWKMVRYADDFVILCGGHQEAQAALEAVKQWTQSAGLILHPTKTRIVDASQKGGFDFLGYHFERGMRWPRKKSLDKLRESMREKTRRHKSGPIGEIILNVNRTLKGWYAYFKQSKPNTFVQVDGFVRRRLRALLMWRKKGRGTGKGDAHHEWPNQWFLKQGLLSLTAEHAYMVTIVRLRTH